MRRSILTLALLALIGGGAAMESMAHRQEADDNTKGDSLTRRIVNDPRPEVVR